MMTGVPMLRNIDEMKSEIIDAFVEIKLHSNTLA